MNMNLTSEPIDENSSLTMRLQPSDLTRFCREVYLRMDLSREDAEITAQVLIEADLRGIPTHGVRLLPRHVEYIQKGIIHPSAQTQIVCETPTTLTIDAHHAMGPAVSAKTMSAIIRKAKTMGTAFASVRNSTHFGIAGYYAAMALEENMIGIAMTNANPVGLPTFGSRGMFGTNPLAVAAPANREAAFVLDMATTVVTNGRIESHTLQQQPLLPGWVVDTEVREVTEVQAVCPGLVSGRNFILPLGGVDDDHGGHKGYNLAVLVDILSAVLGGGAFGPDVRTPTPSYPGPFLSHFFGAINIASFRNPDDFRSDMDRMLNRLKECPPAPGRDRVYYAGLKEDEHAKQCAASGIPVDAGTYDALEDVSRQLGITPPKKV